METVVVKTVKQYSEKVSNIEELQYIAKQYATIKNYVYSRYSGINGLNILKHYKKQIRDVWVKDKFAEQWKLSARYWKQALDEAVSNIKSEWSNTRNRIKIAVSNNSKLSNDEKHFVYYILKSDTLLHSILAYKQFIKPEKLANLDIREKYILNLIRRYVRKHKGSVAYSRKARSFMIDADMYEYKKIDNMPFIEIMGLIKGKRIAIYLKDTNIHKGNLRVVFDESGSLEIHKAKKVKVQSIESNTVELGIDKGYNTLFATSSGNFYGNRLNDFLSKETERLNKVNSKRNRIWAQMNNYIKQGNYSRTELIRLNNFGKVKYNNLKRKFGEQIKSYINCELNRMIDLELPSELIVENLDFVSWTNKYPQHIKRKLSRWIKGYVQKRLEYKCALRGIKLTKVNPAYTSKICHKCGAFGERNGSVFICANCGTMNADYNASVNIKFRKYDKEITLYTTCKKVEQILQNRYNVIKTS